FVFYFFFQAEDGIRDRNVTGVQTCALPICIAPLVWFIANSSVISVSLLLSKLTPLARYLPDLAGMRLFAAPSSIAVQDALEPVSGAIVMTAWALGFRTVAAIVFSRRAA